MTDIFRALCAELLQFGDQAGEIALNEGLWPDCDPGPDWLLDRARAALAQPEPVAPTDEELTLVYAYAVAAAVGNKRGPFKPEDAEAAQLAGLRAVLARYGTAAIQPVPVSERLPGPEDCDSEGRCWMFDDMLGLPSWTLIKVLGKKLEPDMTWLPANALPLPAGEGAS
jgi:hypothetical protein